MSHDYKSNIYDYDYWASSLPAGMRPLINNSTHMKKYIVFIIISFLFSILNAQVDDVLLLDDCLRLAEEKYTGNKQIAPMSYASQNRMKNYNVRWLPSVSLTGQVTYQSEIVQIKTYNPVEGTLMSIDLPLDQYKIQAEITQMLYDGGITRIQKDMEKNALNMNYAC